MKQIDITNQLSLEGFNRIKHFILKNGDTNGIYSNQYSNYPHYNFGEFEAFLTPTLDLNHNCDPLLSDFNQIVIKKWIIINNVPYPPGIEYFTIAAYFSRDTIAKRVVPNPFAKTEGHVYLVDEELGDRELSEAIDCLKLIDKEIKKEE